MTGSTSAEAVLASGGTVITATHRLARHLRRLHDLARGASGAKAWATADVLPLDAWLRRTWEVGALRNAPPGRQRLLSDDESRLVWRRVLAGNGEAQPDSGVVVPLVAGGWRLCQAWGITPASLSAAADSDDARIFANWVRAYLEELERRSWVDSTGLLQRLGHTGAAAGLGTAAHHRLPVAFAGFDPWTPALAALAGSLRAAGRPVSLVQVSRRQGTLRVAAARSESEELARAFTWAAGFHESAAGLPVGIVVPDLEQDGGRARRVGLDILAPGWQLHEPQVRPVALAVGRHLADYPVVASALNFLRLLAFDVPFELASLLVRSCYFTGAGPERTGRAGAELDMRRMPLESVGLAQLLPVLARRAPVLAGRWTQAHVLAAGELGRRSPPGQWSAHFTGWLVAAGWPGDRGLNSEEFQAAEAWQQLLASFAATDEVAGPVPLGVAIGMLAQQARDRPFEPEGADDAIQVLTFRESEGQDFRALWICGMSADRWPPPARPHPLVPVAVQRSAGVPEATPALLEAQTRQRFLRLVGAAEHVVLSWPAEQDQAVTLPSPLLAGLDAMAVPASSVELHPDRQGVAASARIEVVDFDPPPPLPPGQELRGGARVLAMQAVCPARAFVEFRLRGAPLEPPARPLDAAMRGQIAHLLLERLYQLEPCRRGLGEVQPAALRQLFEPLVGEVLGKLLPGASPYLDGLRAIEAERLWPLLLALRDLDASRNGFRTLVELTRQVQVGPLSLRVRLDRLDTLDAGGELVIDYKTGRFATAGWKRPRVPESQLPLYAVSGGCAGLAVVEFRTPGARLRGVGDAGVTSAGILSAEAFFREKDLDWQGALSRWRSQLEALAAEFSAGDFRVDPADRKWAQGQFAGMTRIHDVLPPADGEEIPEGEEE